jgi:hypothetical protein
VPGIDKGEQSLAFKLFLLSLRASATKGGRWLSRPYLLRCGDFGDFVPVGFCALLKQRRERRHGYFGGQVPFPCDPWQRTTVPLALNLLRLTHLDGLILDRSEQQPITDTEYRQARKARIKAFLEAYHGDQYAAHLFTELIFTVHHCPSQ